MPKAQEGLLAVLVLCTDHKGPFHLARKFPGYPGPIFTDDQKVIRLPPEVLGLEMYLGHRAVVQHGRNAANQE